MGNSYCVEENYGRAPVTSSSKTSMSITSSTTMTTATAPAPTQNGLTSDCKSYYKVKSGDGCQGIVDMYGTFTLSDFYGWNPYVASTICMTEVPLTETVLLGMTAMVCSVDTMSAWVQAQHLQVDQVHRRLQVVVPLQSRPVSFLAVSLPNMIETDGFAYHATRHELL